MATGPNLRHARPSPGRIDSHPKSGVRADDDEEFSTNGDEYRPYGGALCVLLFAWNGQCTADDSAAAARFHERVEPILETYCYGCHGFGERKGGHAFDEFKSDKALVGDVKLWLAVLKNVRAGVMPPADEVAADDDERKQLFDWIELDVFGSTRPIPIRVASRCGGSIASSIAIRFAT